VGPTDILMELTRLGVVLVVAGDRLRFRPREAVSEDLRGLILEHKYDLLRLLAAEEAEVRWRVQVMRRQIRPGPIIPFLVARRDFVDAPGRCLSCGDPCGPGRRYRCSPCVRAAEIVVNESWEGRHRLRAGAPEEQHHDQ
jgi:hypothetical protein